MAKTTKRARRERRAPNPKYTEQIVLIISKEVRAVIDVAARENDLSQAAVARAFLHAGMVSAGYSDVKTTDEKATIEKVEVAP